LNIIEELQSPIFYIAFIVSFGVAMLLVTWVHYITISLDKQYSWLLFPVQRSFRQVVSGVIVPLFIDFALLSIYFYFLGSNIFENVFIKHDFPVIVCFVLLLNAYYLSFYLYKVGKSKQQTPIQVENIDYNMVHVVDRDWNGNEMTKQLIVENELEKVTDSGIPMLNEHLDTEPNNQNTFIIDHNGVVAKGGFLTF
jgi:hypothetical protein